MKNILKYLSTGCFVFVLFCNYGFSQCYCDDLKIIELKDSTISGQASFTFKMTSDSSNCGTGYSDFWFIDQIGDTINEWTGSGMWLPNPLNPMLDTTKYIIKLKPGYSSFPSSFAGHLKVWNPDCTIPLSYTTFNTIELVNLNANIQFFPNPTTNELKVLNESNFVITSIKVYDSSGKLIVIKNKDTDYIKTDTFLSGVYYIKAYSNEEVIAVEKFIKN